MNAQVLIDSVVRQITVLIAQLATSGGVRAPLAHIAHQVFLELATELEAQGVSRKVSADMFGMALRAYIRKVRRLTGAQTEHGRTLWQAVLDYLREEQLVTRDHVLSRFRRDDEVLVSAVLHDLVESGVVFCSGTGRAAIYRAASDEDLGRLGELGSERGLDELSWVLVYRDGPMSVAELAQRLSRSPQSTAEIVERLVGDGRVRRLDDGRLAAEQFVIVLGSSVGWEAAVFDHIQAVVQTICQRLRRSSPAPAGGDVVGGSTYSFDVWPGHPLEREVMGRLSAFREELGSLRQKVEAANRQSGLPSTYQQVVSYVGQCILERECQSKPLGVDDEDES
jgi:hypothetical protein